MLTFNKIYENYPDQNPKYLVSLIENELSDNLGLGFAKDLCKLRECISQTNYYIENRPKNGKIVYPNGGRAMRVTGEAFINHPLRVALILLHERLYDMNLILSAIMHNLFRDTEYTYEAAAKDFGDEVANMIKSVTAVSTEERAKLSEPGLSAEQIDYAALIENCNKRKTAFFIKFADRLDILMTLDTYSPEKQIKRIKDTKLYLLPIINQVGARRFGKFVSNAVYKWENRSSYQYLEKIISDEYVFESTIETFKRLEKVFKNDYFTKIQISFPSIYEISEMLSAERAQKIKFDQSKIIYDVYFIAKDDSVLPKCAEIAEQFNKSPDLSEYAIEMINTDGFNFVDNIENHYKVTITTGTNYNLLQYGNTEKDINPIDPKDIDDDLSEETHIVVYTPSYDSVLLPVGSTVIDFAFKIHNDVGAHMIKAYRNDKEVDPYTELRHKDVVKIITSDFRSDPNVKVNWLINCKTKRAKRVICKLLQERIDKMQEIINNSEK